MKPPAFDYVEPDVLDEAVEVLTADDEARPLAGGQSLVPMLNFRLARPTTLVGLRRLGELRGIERSDAEIRIGAMVTQSEALGSEQVRVACPLVYEALACVGHPQIRSRGTIGGSLAQADPAAELPAVMLALGGSATIYGPDGSRRASADELFLGPYVTTLRPGEVITDVRFQCASAHAGASCVELARRPGDFAVVGVSCQITLGPDATVRDARVALFGVGGKPVRARAVEHALKGAGTDDKTSREAASLVVEDWQQPAAASEADRYRRRVVTTVVRRAIVKAASRAL